MYSVLYIEIQNFLSLFSIYYTSISLYTKMNTEKKTHNNQYFRILQSKEKQLFIKYYSFAFYDTLYAYLIKLILFTLLFCYLSTK